MHWVPTGPKHQNLMQPSQKPYEMSLTCEELVRALRFRSKLDFIALYV